jgi:hypothetical protein
MPREFWLVLAFLGGCASGLLAPESVRQSEFLEKTTVKKTTAYLQAIRWFDKNLKQFGGASRSQEMESGKIKMQGAYACNTLRKPNDSRDYFLSFDLEFEAGPQFIQLHFTQLRMENSEGQLIPKAEAQLSTVGNVDRVQPCLKKLVASLSKAVESTTLTW